MYSFSATRSFEIGESLRTQTAHKVCCQLLNKVAVLQSHKQPGETLGVMIALHGHITAKEYDGI